MLNFCLTTGISTIFSIFSTPPYFVNSLKLRIPANYAGVVLTCSAFAAPELNWFKNTEIGRESTTSNIRNGEGVTSAELIFRNGFKAINAGEYICSADVVSSQTAIFTIDLGDAQLSEPSCSVDSPSRLFQIRVLDTPCNEWDASLKQLIKYQFLRSIIVILSTQCDECSINDDNLMITHGPICSSERKRAALFRGIIANSSIAFCALNTWQRSGPVMVINNNLHIVDRLCNSKITSLYAPECQASVGESAMIGDIVFIGAASGFGLLVALVGCIGFVFIIRSR